jgi:hypothetical protein
MRFKGSQLINITIHHTITPSQCMLQGEPGSSAGGSSPPPGDLGELRDSTLIAYSHTLPVR